MPASSTGSEDCQRQEFCRCGRCGDIFIACRLEDSPGSRNSPLAQIVCERNILQATFAIGRILKNLESKESKRKSEEDLYNLWKDVELTDLGFSFWLPSLPRWVKNDQVLRHILGLSSSAVKDAITHQCGQEISFEPSPASLSNFTSFESHSLDNPSTNMTEPSHGDHDANAVASPITQKISTHRYISLFKPGGNIS